MIDNLAIIKKTFELKYAPAEWKKECYGWDLEKEYEKSKKAILDSPSPSLKDFHHILRQFFLSTADYHVNVFFHSTEVSFLPFSVQGAEERYFIASTDSSFLPHEALEWEIGDEVISFDGKPVHELVKQRLTSQWDRRNPLTDQRFAEISLTQRSGVFGEPTPQGPVVVEVRSKHTSETKSYVLNWEYYPEQVKEVQGKADLIKKGLKLPFNIEMITPYYACFNKIAELKKTKSQILGSRRSFVPPLGKVLWENSESSPYHAYIFETPAKVRLGYVRIPIYQGGEREVEEFAKLIDMFQQLTEGLVIDQVNNPGGLVFYQYALLSHLTDKPLKLPTYQVTLTQEDVMEALDSVEILSMIENDFDAQFVCGESAAGYPIDYQFVQGVIKYFHFILKQWEEGNYFTEATSLLLDKIAPSHSICYTKPLIVLVNELDFSCGDTFASILQDNQRAIIFGTNTAGAGGVVTECAFTNRLGIAHYTYTTSLMIRNEKEKIENVGVKPDVGYQLTAEDYQNGYQGYLKALQAVIEQVTR